MPDPKKKMYAPYGSDKVNVDASGNATPKAYPKKRTMSTDPKNGKSMINVADEATKKMLFSKPDVGAGGAKESNKFKSDSTNYMNQGKRQAEKINIGKIASAASSTSQKENLIGFVKGKKKM
jgi:hypothetical protein